ncbi:LPXTG cell wall anchor domain-containing protein [Microbacterium lemovicicum]|uniref:LPXTG cell wall anchor domain-containing protein n=1 Tax=Microbacterium lemovicicum TaxID=1072463 RepID=UPI000F8F25C9|nr:LPXTG cell wall anchor domain-containing protein [Microbacterium lemovicicum]
MKNRFAWRRMLALPAAAALALGGLLISAPAASAAETPAIIITSPLPGGTLQSRTVTISGVANAGASVVVTSADGLTELGRTEVPGTDGAATPFSVELTPYADDAPTAQSVLVTATYDGTPLPPLPLDFVLPAGPQDSAFDVLSPMPGETVLARTVVFAGTGDDGATVTVVDGEGQPVAGTAPVVVADGQWITVGTYDPDAPTAQSVTVTQVLEGAPDEEKTVEFALPVLLPAPVITAPTAGQALTGSTVTFTGTGTPGTNVLLAVLPTASLQELSAQAAEPADPEDPIVVDAAGTWSVTVELLPGDWTAAAVLVQLDENGQVANILSDPSAEVQFTLTPAVAPVVPANTVKTLANTGPKDVGGFAVAGVLFTVAGAALMVARRRRVTS